MLLQRGMSSPQILKVQEALLSLGMFKGTPKGNFGELTEKAVRAFQRSENLTLDGKVGDETWGALFVPVEGTPQAAAVAPPRRELPAWLMEALQDLNRGVAEINGIQHTPEIVQAHGYTTLKAKDDETPWCSSIMCAWTERAGLKSTQSAAADSWRKWGKELGDGDQRLGCVVVMSRTGGNHVTLYLDEDDVGVYCLGGNQGDRVSIRRYEWGVITNFRWPE